MTLIDDLCDGCGRRFDPMGDPLLTRHPEISEYAVLCATCESKSRASADTETLAEVLAAVMIQHQRIPTYSGDGGNRCVGCDNLAGESDGSNSPRHVAHVAAAQADAIAARIVQARAGEGALRERVEDALMLARCQIGAFKAAQSAIGNLDREHINVLEVGRILSRLRDEVGTDFTNKVRAALTTAEPGLPGYFVHPDGLGAPVIWHGTGPTDPTCRPVLEGWRVQAVAPDLWGAIAALVEGKP